MTPSTPTIDAALVDSLAQTLEADGPTYQHSREVQHCCARIAQELGWDEFAQQAASIAGLLHDIGKTDIPDAILRKPGPLTAQEWTAVKQHPQRGAEIVAAAPGLERIAEAIRYHHERWDGSGYPEGITGNRIPRLARLIAVAEAFCTLTADQPYRQAVTEAAARDILAQGAGTQWDAAVVAALGRALDKETV